METTVHLDFDKQLNSFIQDELKSGKYKSVKDLVKSAIKLLKEREQAQQKLSAELEKGEQSGYIENYDFQQHLRELHEKNL